MKTAIYARVSTTDQDCTQQLTALREYVATRGWTAAGEYVDQAVSGAKDRRPALDRLVQDARMRKVDCIVVWKLDRWGRSLIHLAASMDELRTMGVRFIAVTQGIDTDQTSATGKLLMNILASFAEFERELIKERTAAGVARARKEGKTIGRPRLVVDRQKVLDMRAAGMSLRAIAQQTGSSAASVLRILA